MKTTYKQVLGAAGLALAVAAAGSGCSSTRAATVPPPAMPTPVAKPVVEPPPETRVDIRETKRVVEAEPVVAGDRDLTDAGGTP
jgi:hypothetical protein